MALPIRAEEELGFDAVPLDAPPGQDLCAPLGADHAVAAEIAGRVSVDAARKQELQQHAVVVKAVWCDQQAAIGESAIAPEVAAGK